ncbi:cytidylyltransferase domain-containing protein [Carnobacterium sp.]|uniref:acylneuraminate cytidylyltransferase family protein n=1 Tax=Carnobacterium sp. TaxID=48221 RepID=UPI00388D803D
MFRGKKIIAIIPARSGSKGLKDKNIKLLNGKSLIAYTIEAAKNAQIFDDIIVSTDSEKYAEIAKKYGASIPFLRPKSLASDTSASNDVIKFTINELEKKNITYDYFMLLQPTSPLRNKDDIVNALELLFEKNGKSIVSVCESEHSPYLMNQLNESLSMENFLLEHNNKRRQELTPFYRLNGAIYLCDVETYKINNSYYGEKSIAYIMDKIHSIDIDDEIDFKLAELLLKDNIMS